MRRTRKLQPQRHRDTEGKRSTGVAKRRARGDWIVEINAARQGPAFISAIRITRACRAAGQPDPSNAASADRSGGERVGAARSLCVSVSLWLNRLCVLCFLCVGGAACRQDMHDQPKYIPLRESTFFDDARSARPIVAGTVARGQLRDDLMLYTGKQSGSDVDTFPFPVTASVMARGQERFNIYCSPCHGRTGQGDGMIVQRGYRRPPTYHQDRLRQAPVGHFFDVITNGFGAMPDYAAQIRPDDRWAIVAYIRALQLSEHASLADVPATQRRTLDVH